MNSIEYIKDNTTEEEYEILCTQCSGKTAHKVVSSYGLIQVHDDGRNYSDWTTDNQIIQCLGCKTISFRKANSGSEEDHVDHVTIYPARVDGIKGFSNDIHYLPTNVRRIYDETLQALSNQSPVLAGIGLRALLEAVCKDQHATGKILLEQIDNLVSKKVLTPVSASFLHKIRALGNSSAHEVKPHNNRQLEVAMNIVEHLLKDVYILPKQVESEFGDDV